MSKPTCKTCLHWSTHQPKDWFGKCALQVVQAGYPDAENCGGIVPINKIADTSGHVWSHIEYGKDFGCIHHEVQP